MDILFVNPRKARSYYMKNKTVVQTDIYSETIVLLKLYLVSPATNAISEHQLLQCIALKTSWEVQYHKKD